MGSGTQEKCNLQSKDCIFLVLYIQSSAEAWQSLGCVVPKPGRAWAPCFFFLFNSQDVQLQVKIIDLARCVLPKQTSVCDLGSSPSLDVATHGLLVKMARKKNAIFKIKIAFFLVFIMVAMEIM